ncbi:Rap1a/Tai family immunity protein [Altericroceibacterium xinjiangense]|uniref:Rap1a/Tai family immunity protein n=1 Tax=Altericroceibacterium xinjiangense TaxID=762261 RepID=UPI003B96B6D8
MAFLLTLPAPAISQDANTFGTGNTFLSHCGDELRDECVIYSVGVWHGAMTMTSLVEPIVCFPSGVTGGQLFRVGINFMRDNPDKGHWKPAELLVMSWAEAFPCQPGQKP